MQIIHHNTLEFLPIVKDILTEYLHLENQNQNQNQNHQHEIKFKFKLAFLGLSTLDHLWYVSQLPEGDGKIRAKSYQIDVGGMATNAAITAKILGADVHLFTHIADDETAKIIQQQLTDHQLNIEQYPFKSAEPNTQSAISAVVIAQNGERMIINRPDEYLKQSLDHIHVDDQQIQKHIENLLKNAKVLEVDTRWPKATEIALKLARAQGIPSVMDAEKTTLQTLKKLIHQTDFVIFSKAGLKHFAQEFAHLSFELQTLPHQTCFDLHSQTMILSMLQMIALLKSNKEKELTAILQNLVDFENNRDEMLQYLQTKLRQEIQLLEVREEIIAVTMAEYGVFILDLSTKNNHEVLHHFDIYQTSVVDTNGAGDAFHGAFAWAIAHFFEIKKQKNISFSSIVHYATVWASYIAALKCQNAGRLRDDAIQAFEKINPA